MADLYNPGQEAVQVTASPNIATQMVRNDPMGDSHIRLAQALGVAMPAAQQAIQTYTNKQSQDAEAYANSLTLDDLKKKVQNRELLPSQNPAYVATVEHIYGQNAIDKLRQDTLSQIQTGQLTFASNDDLQKYLVSQRNEVLQGQSRYTITGFDKNWADTTGALASVNARINDSAFVARGTQEATESLRATAAGVASPVYTGTPEEAALEIQGKLKFLRDTHVIMTPDQSKDALDDITQSLAMDGKHEVLGALLGSKNSDGISVSSILGGMQSRRVLDAAVSTDDANQKQRVDTEVRPFLDAAEGADLTGKKRSDFDAWVNSNERWFTTSQRQAVLNAQRISEDRLARGNAKAQVQLAVQRSTEAAKSLVAQGVASGNLPQLLVHGAPRVLKADGTDKEFDVEAEVKQVIPQIVAANKLPFEKELEMWNQSGFKSPELERAISSGVENLSSVTKSYDGKPVGQLNQQGQAALDTFEKLYQVSPDAAQKYAGGNWKLLDDIHLMRTEGGIPDPSAAAIAVNRCRGIPTSDVSLKMAAAKKAVDDLTARNLFFGDNSKFNTSVASVGQFVGGLFGGTGAHIGLNEEKNYAPVIASIQRQAGILSCSGPSPDEAAQLVIKRLKDPGVAQSVNGTVYWTKDLPTVPKGESQADWMGRFIKEVPGKIAGDADLQYVNLLPGENGTYVAYHGGIPMHTNAQALVAYTRKDIESWVTKTYQADVDTRAAQSSYQHWSDQLQANPPWKSVNDAQDVKPQILFHHGQPIPLSTYSSRANYDRMKAAGLLDKPFKEQLDFMTK